ncbi:MAG TPA: glycosyltransferase family 2 protein [Gammaproteobacteria bacterium]|nr:glycosyltransferase family 2 protein [Gammaproteobacteria bacterium]
MRIVVILACYNEERFLRQCLEHYREHGVEVYLLDNGSTDATRAIAEEFTENPVIGIEALPRGGSFDLSAQLRRKEQIAETLKADWVMHADPDEVRLPPAGFSTLASAVQHVDSLGYNAINFQEYTFIPVREAPDHEHPRFRETMRWYYPFSPRHPHRLNLWKQQRNPLVRAVSVLRRTYRARAWPPLPAYDLSSSGGHVVRFAGIKPYPYDFIMKHYLVLSLDHAKAKYVDKTFSPAERNWHGWRATAEETDFVLPSAKELNEVGPDGAVEAIQARSTHFLEW